jgi:hypothetical protein
MQTRPPTAGAQLAYTMLHRGDLVITDTCENVIRAIDSRVHDRKNRLRLRKWSAIPNLALSAPSINSHELIPTHRGHCIDRENDH